MLAELKVERGAAGVGKRFVIRLGQRFVIGRSNASVLLVDPAVSRQHAQIELREGGELFLADLNSRNGTHVDGAPLMPYRPLRLKNGSLVEIGGHALRVINYEAVDDETRKVLKPTPQPLLVPQDDLRILGELGRGAHGYVYAAHQVLMDRRVALKVLRLINEEEVKRFLEEARLACRVRSPHVVEVYDVRVVEGVIYMLMELVDGCSLHDRISGGQRLEIPEVLQIGKQVALGLHAVHQEGVVHRDVKPSNILLCPAGVAKLSDFGIAKDLGGTNPALTPDGQGLGSLPYMAPEQIDGRGVDTRTDIYGLGATLYRLLTGEHPFKQRGPAAVLEIIERPPHDVRTLRSDCPVDVARLVMGMLEKDRAARPASARSVARQLGELSLLCYPDWGPAQPRTSRMSRTQGLESVDIDLTTRDTGPPTPSAHSSQVGAPTP